MLILQIHEVRAVLTQYSHVQYKNVKRGDLFNRYTAYYPEDISENISRIFVVLVHARTCLLRVGALRVHRC